MATIIGTNGGDGLVGTNSKDVIIALDDDDVVQGRGGNDWIDGGSGRDRLWGGTGDDTIVGSLGIDTTYGGAGDDLIGLIDDSRNASPGAQPGDLIYGDSFNDFFDFTASNQQGNDIIYGSSEADAIYGDNGGDPNLNDGGHDTVFAGNGSDTVFGEGGNDSISGEGGNDSLSGGEGKDTLAGGDGNDTITGGGGADVIDGGAGDDRIVYNAVSDSSGNKNDTINAFVSGMNYSSGDKIDITAVAGSNEIHWFGAAPAFPIAYSAWYQPVAGGVKLMVDSTGDGAADLQVVVQGANSLKHSDILGVFNRPLGIIGENTNDGDPVVEAGNATLGDPTASGRLLVNGTGFDLEGDRVVVANTGAYVGTYGDLTLTEDGWSYVLDDDRPQTNALAEGETATDDFSVVFTDGLVVSNPVDLLISVTGSNDAPVFGQSTGTVLRASTDASGVQGNHHSDGSTFSPDSTKVAFYSGATNLVPDDTNNAGDVFIKDLATGAIVRVNTDAFGVAGNDLAITPAFSPDGSWIAFASTASNLVAGDTNGTWDIFVKNLASGAVVRASTDPTGAQGQGDSLQPVFSPDGSKVMFMSGASNLVPGDTNLWDDIFIKDLASGAISRVSTDSSGSEADGFSVGAVFSPDGTKVAFVSYATNLVQDDANGMADVFVKDLITGQITLVSTDSFGGAGDSDAYASSLGFSASELMFSPDGAKLAFASFATNLVPSDTNGTLDVFVKDLVTGSVTRVSTDATGLQGNGHSSGPSFSPDGQKILFDSIANNLVPNDPFWTDVFLKDLATGEIIRVSNGGNWDSDGGVFSADGNHVTFRSFATNLVAGDSNNAIDVFVTGFGAATITEDDNTFASGGLSFSDAELTDTHTVQAAPAAGGYLGTFMASLSDDSTGDGSGSISWSFSVDNALLQFLDSGETLIQTYTISVDDGLAADSQDVTIVIQGQDERPRSGGGLPPDPVPIEILLPADVFNPPTPSAITGGVVFLTSEGEIFSSLLGAGKPVLE